MRVINSYYIERDNIYIWLNYNIEPLETDEVVELRPILVADEGKTLWKDNEEYGPSIWLRGDDIKDNYTEEYLQEES